MLDVVLLALSASTPLLLAVEGELVVQRSGIINLGIEGMLLAAAFGAALGGIPAGIGAAAIVGALFGFFAITLHADQIVTGTAVNLLALGVTGFAYRQLSMKTPPPFGFDWVTPFAWIVAPLLAGALLWNTTLGLRVRAAGENPEALPHVILSREDGEGSRPRRSFASLRMTWGVSSYRWLALAVEALLAGLGGSHLALALSSGFAENMTAGRGFIALAVVIFARWNLRGALAGTALFGITAALQYALQASNRGVPYHLLLAVPYVVTLLILCGITGRVRAPEALGK